MKNPLENFKNPFDADGDFAKNILDTSKFLGGNFLKPNLEKVSEDTNYTNPIIYIFSTGFNSYQMNTIASYIKGIYRKQSTNDVLKVDVKVISPEEHFGKRAFEYIKNNINMDGTTQLDEGKKYGRNETFVEIINIDSKSADRLIGDETYLLHDKDTKELYILFCLTIFDSTRDNLNLYHIAYRAAHEALHAFICKAIFYTEGLETYKQYRAGNFEYLGSDDGHINKGDLLESPNNTNNFINLNMSGLQVGSQVPDKYYTELKPAERIIRHQRILLYDFFHNFMKQNKNVYTNKKNIQNYSTLIYRKIV